MINPSKRPLPCLAFALAALLAAGSAVAQQQPDRSPAQPAAAQAALVTEAQQKSAVDRIAALLAQRYVFEDKGREAGRHIQDQLAAGAFRELTDPAEFAETLTEALQSITNDKHMRVRPMRPQAGMPVPASGGETQQSPAQRILNLAPPVREGNFGFQKIEYLPGNVGYLKLDGFASDPAARETASAAMNFLAGCDALIVDLRENGGGSPEMIRYLSSYLFDEPTHLNSLYWREGDRTQEFWTTTDVPGKRMGQDVPLFVLTSSYTFSGGEEFAYNIQTQQRGTLIGETTGGGANPGGVYPVDDRFVIFIPTGRAVNPVTNTNWEGVGVKPHIDLPAADAYDKALELAAEAAGARREKRSAEVMGLRQEVAAALDSFGSGGEPALAAALERAIRRGALGEMEINIAGYGYLEAGQVEPALALFRFNASRYPDSPNVHDSLGEALEKAGRLAEARDSYQKAVDLAAGDSDGQEATYKANLQRVRAKLSEPGAD